LPLADQRPERHLLQVRVTHWEVGRSAGQPVEVLIGHRRMNDVAARGHADLALMQEGAPGAGRACYLQVSIIQDDERVVAAELKRDPLQSPACRRANLAADGGRAGEGDHGQVWSTPPCALTQPLLKIFEFQAVPSSSVHVVSSPMPRPSRGVPSSRSARDTSAPALARRSWPGLVVSMRQQDADWHKSRLSRSD
jgi:hypothetical protein